MGRIQIQSVTLSARGQPLQTPMPNGAKGTQVDGRAVKDLKETGEARLAADAPNAQHRRQSRVAPQKGHLGQLFGPLQNARHKT